MWGIKKEKVVKVDSELTRQKIDLKMENQMSLNQQETWMQVLIAKAKDEKKITQEPVRED